jgi:hypothetical protein
MQPLPFEIVDDRGARIGDHWHRVLVLIAGILLAAGVAWWVGLDPLALIAEETYLNPFSLMLGFAVLAILWQVARAFFVTLSIRRDGAATLVVKPGSSLRQRGNLVGEVRLGASALARLKGHAPRIELVCEDVYAVQHVGEPHRQPRLIPIESARVIGDEITRYGAGRYAFTVAVPQELKPIAEFVERSDGTSNRAGFSGAAFVTVPFMTPRLVGGAKGKPAFRRWRVEVLGADALVAFDISERIDATV